MNTIQPIQRDFTPEKNKKSSSFTLNDIKKNHHNNKYKRTPINNLCTRVTEFDKRKEQCTKLQNLINLVKL